MKLHHCSRASCMQIIEALRNAQIGAMLRTNGRAPADAATIGKQAMQIAELRSALAALTADRDAKAQALRELVEAFDSEQVEFHKRLDAAKYRAAQERLDDAWSTVRALLAQEKP